jgi:hypothetical protein
MWKSVFKWCVTIVRKQKYCLVTVTKRYFLLLRYAYRYTVLSLETTFPHVIHYPSEQVTPTHHLYWNIPSKCQQWFGPYDLYALRLNLFPLRALLASGSMSCTIWATNFLGTCKWWFIRRICQIFLYPDSSPDPCIYLCMISRKFSGSTMLFFFFRLYFASLLFSVRIQIEMPW